MTSEQKVTEQIEEIAKKAAEKAVLNFVKNQKQTEKQKHDARIRNIKLLLRNYRNLKKHTDGISNDIDLIDEKLELDEFGKNELLLESVRKSKYRTLAMIKYVDKMLESYKELCEITGNEEDLRSYQTLKLKYLDESRKTDKEIMETLCVSKRTIYRDIERACETLSMLIFGVDSIRVK